MQHVYCRKIQFYFLKKNYVLVFLSDFIAIQVKH